MFVFKTMKYEKDSEQTTISEEEKIIMKINRARKMYDKTSSRNERNKIKKIAKYKSSDTKNFWAIILHE